MQEPTRRVFNVYPRIARADKDPPRHFLSELSRTEADCSFPSRFQQADQLRKLKVLLADDHPDLLEKVASLLEATFEVVGRVGDGQSLFDAAMNLQPDLIISDISMPILNGIEAASKLKESGCRSKVVFLTVHADPDYVLRCSAIGALGYVVKRRMASDLLPAINEALAGRNFISPNIHFQNYA